MANNQYTSPECADARARGDKKYWPAEPCSHGHVSQKYTSDQSCVECKRVKSLERRRQAANDTELAKTMRRWQRDAKRRKRQTKQGRSELYQANKRYVEANRDKVAAYYRQKRKTDPSSAMACWMRSTLHKVLQRANLRKDARCVDILGYDGETLRLHIEAQFLKGMNWDNRHLWHIDHIVPVAEFMRRGETNPKVVNALTNLRPIWAEENMGKRDKLTHLL